MENTRTPDAGLLIRLAEWVSAGSAAKVDALDRFMQDELSGIIGRKVDLNTPGFLSRYFRDRVVAGAHLVYDSRRS
jgi:predicted nucleotidyltransferase